MRRSLWVSLLVLVTMGAGGPPAHAAFPYLPGSDPSDYGQYRLRASDPRPGELTSGAKQSWMYAADQEPGNEPVNSDPRELNGVRGAHLVDRTTPNDDLAWATTTGRPDVTISVLDSGIKWNDREAMLDLRRKMRLTRAEVPTPNANRSTPLETGAELLLLHGAGRRKRRRRVQRRRLRLRLARGARSRAARRRSASGRRTCSTRRTC